MNDEWIHGKWSILFRKNTDRAWKEFRAPEGYFYADPFVIRKENLWYVFFEWYNYRTGRLAYFTVDDYLNRSEIKFLDIPIDVHVSYPYLIGYGDELYMIPETCHLNKINLYQCVRFPDKWAFVSTLVSDVHAGDSTVFFGRDKYWYMLTTIYSGNRNHFQIYYSNMLGGNWRPHKIVNENYSSPLNGELTRGAGRVIVREGKLLRPAQYSDRSINGEAVILYHIKTLSNDSYLEHPIRIIQQPHFRANHTYSRNSGLVVVDARQIRYQEKKEKFINQISERKRIMEVNQYYNHEKLSQAFGMNTSGNGKCYYGATIAGKYYPGERNFDLRWTLIKDSVNFRNKKVLELGCNMAILSAFLSKYRGISWSICVDAPDSFLQETNKPDTIKAGKILSEAFFLQNLEFLQVDFNEDEYDVILSDDFDIVFCLSLLKWIKNENYFMKFLSKFKTVFFEGHEDDDFEIARFSKWGFQAKILGRTQTGESYSPDDARTLILFTK